jgi:hypothetical protein
VLYRFDEERHGILIIGGDKQGKDGSAEDKFYKNLIKKAEDLMLKYKNYTWEEKDQWQTKN